VDIYEESGVAIMRCVFPESEDKGKRVDAFSVVSRSSETLPVSPPLSR